MNKLFIALSIGLALTACAPHHPQQDPNALPNGIMQPVEGTGAVAGGSFMPEIQQNSMPNGMK